MSEVSHLVASKDALGRGNGIYSLGVKKFITFSTFQDGSCNGLQHYAAIGRDRLGAAAVNLVPADKPQVNAKKI